MDMLRLIIAKTPALLFWSVIVFLSLLLTHNALLYFTHGGEYGILPEKIEARKNELWNLSFYLHLPAGILCLLMPWFSFARRLFRFTNAHHALAGKLYSGITLIVVCPTGMYLALFAKGGLITAVGFLLQGILLLYFTFQGYRAGRRSRIVEHINFMIRSYSVALVVLTFRLMHLSFFFLHIPYKDNYAISQWLGLSLNLLIAEVLVFLRSRKYPSLKTQII
jgi:hypothetical protein